MAYRTHVERTTYLGEFITNYRYVYNISQQALAEYLGCTKQYISLLEVGKYKYVKKEFIKNFIKQFSLTDAEKDQLFMAIKNDLATEMHDKAEKFKELIGCSD